MTKINLITLFFCLAFLGNSAFAQTKYHKDFMEFWDDINNHYAYLKQRNIDWDKVKEIYEPQVKKITNDTEFIKFLEKVLNELYDGHTSLNVNLKSSNRLIPSGMDICVKKVNNKFYINDIRRGFGADLAGLKIGMEVKYFQGKSIEEQLKEFLPKFTNQPSSEMIQYALDMLFAGTHDTKREISVIENGKEKVFYPETYTNSEDLLFFKILNETTAYIKINNTLGNNDLILEFDKIIDKSLKYNNLILDLTETPSGGNSMVARAIMGRFVSQPFPYQIHEFDEKIYQTKRHWVEYVFPRKDIYQGNVFVLVGRWTGSMGEGIAIGFDGMKRAKIIGTPMAGLLGAVTNFELTETKIRFQFPTERLYHINGKPRETFIPEILTENIEKTEQIVKEIR